MKKRKIFISVLTMIAIVFGFYVVKEIYFNSGTDVDLTKEYESLKKDPKDKTPEESTSIENLSYVLWTMEHCTQYSSKTIGTLTASMWIIDHVQTVDNYKCVNGEYLVTTSISDSSLKSVVEETFFVDDKVLIRQGELSSKEIVWDDKCDVISEDMYKENYGLKPYALNNFVLNAETILESSMEKSEENYVLFLTLDPSLATYYYMRQVKTLANANDYPDFSSLKLEITFNSNYQVLEFKTFEKYKIDMPVLGNATIVSEYSEIFDYENYNIDQYRQYYEQYYNQEINTSYFD